MTRRVPICIAVALATLPAGIDYAAASGSVRSSEASVPVPLLATEPEHLYAAPTRPDRIGRVIAPVKINGQGPFRMIVDTGANQSVLTTRVAAVLGVTPTPGRNVKLSGVTGSLIVPTVSIARFETGDLVQEDLQLPVIQSVMGGADGILGMQGFANKRITVDFVNDRIQIANSRGQRAIGNVARLPVKVRFDRLLLATGRVSGVKVHAVIDTGAERTLGNLALYTELMRRKRLHQTPASTSVVGLTEVAQPGDAIYTRKISLGDIVISDVAVIYGDIHVFKLWGLEDQPALLVGMDVLGALHTLVVDYRLKELQIRVKD